MPHIEKWRLEINLQFLLKGSKMSSKWERRYQEAERRRHNQEVAKARRRADADKKRMEENMERAYRRGKTEEIEKAYNQANDDFREEKYSSAKRKYKDTIDQIQGIRDVSFRDNFKRRYSFACYRLGRIFFDGLGIEQNRSKAVNYLHKSDNGNALNLLGYMHENGICIEKCTVLAARYYVRAARDDHIVGMKNYIKYCLDGKVDFTEGWHRDDVPEAYQKTSQGRYIAAAKWLKKAAELDDIDSQYRYGMMCKKGQGTNKDSQAAANWLQKAASNGHLLAKYQMGKFYQLGGSVIRKDLPKAHEIFHELYNLCDAVKKNNDSDVFYILGKMYYHGFGVKQNRLRAFENFYCAADISDHQSALFYVARMLRDGDGANKEVNKSVRAFKRLADNGHAKAQLILGIMHLEGSEVDQNSVAAVMWLRKAAKQGNIDAIYRLAQIYIKGSEPIEADIAEAISLHTQATERGHTDAPYRLGQIFQKGHGVPTDIAAAKHWFSIAAERGHKKAKKLIEDCASKVTIDAKNKASQADAQFELGQIYENGDGVEQSYREAKKWYLKAAELGDVRAQYRLAILFEKGVRGIPRNIEQAEYWGIKAADGEDPNAQYLIGKLYEDKGYPTRAITYYTRAVKQNHIGSQRRLGVLYFEGKAVSNNILAIRYLKLAKNQGDVEAQFFLGQVFEKLADKLPTMYPTSISTEYLGIVSEISEELPATGGASAKNYYNAAKRFYCIAADCGHTEAARKYAEMCFTSKSKCEKESGRRYIKSAAKGGDAEAQFFLAKMYKDGKHGQTKDKVQAIYWLRKANDLHHPEAAKKLKKIKVSSTMEVEISAIDANKKEIDKTGSEKSIGKVKACYNYAASNDDELSFSEGDVLELLSHNLNGSGWSRCRLNGNEGLIPHNYVEDYNCEKNSESKIAQLILVANGEVAIQPTKKDTRKTSKSIKKKQASRSNDSQMNSLVTQKAELLPQKTSHATPVSGELIINPNELQKQEKLSAGGFGTVYMGIWHGSEVAIKELHLQNISEQGIRDFQNEADHMKRLQSPLVVQLFGITLSPPYCIVMEYMQGGSLCDLLHSEKEIRWKRRVKLGLQIANALKFLHSQSVMHRDIKSMNVLMGKHGKVAKLGDFGLAKLKQETISTTTSTVGSNAGTLAWMPPELFSPNGKPSYAGDVYSFGVVLWELASRQFPFENAANAALIPMWVAQGHRPEIPDDTPDWYGDLLTQCWRQNAAERPSMTVVVQLMTLGLQQIKTGLVQLQHAERKLEEPEVATNKPNLSSASGQCGFFAGATKGESAQVAAVVEFSAPVYGD